MGLEKRRMQRGKQQQRDFMGLGSSGHLVWGVRRSCNRTLKVLFVYLKKLPSGSQMGNFRRLRLGEAPLRGRLLLSPYLGPSPARPRGLASVPAASDLRQAACVGPPGPPGARKLGDSRRVLSRAGSLWPCEGPLSRVGSTV